MTALTGLEAIRRISIQEGLIEFKTSGFGGLAGAISPFGGVLPTPELELGNLRPIPIKLFRGAVTLEQTMNRIWQLSFTIDDTTRVLTGGGIFDRSEPSKLIASLWGRSVKFVGGYVIDADQSGEPQKSRIEFDGFIKSVSPSFNPEGDVQLTITAQGVNFRLTRDLIRRITYPSPKCAETKDEAENAANESGNPSLARVYNRPWAEGTEGTDPPSISVGEIVKNIAEQVHQIKADVDPIFFRAPHIFTQETADGRPKTILQENESDWRFLQRLAKQFNAFVWTETLPPDQVPAVEEEITRGTEAISPVTGGPGHYVRFKKDFTLQNQTSKAQFVYNTPFGDGERLHFVRPEDINLLEPGQTLPMLNISPSMDLVIAAPAARGYKVIQSDGSVQVVMSLRDPIGDYEYFALKSRELYEQYKLWLEDRFEASDEVLELFRTMERLGKAPSYEQLLETGYVTVETVRALREDSPDQEPRAQYWRPNWSLAFDTIGTPFVRPGDLVELFNLASFMDGTWIVQAIRHTFDQNTWQSNITVARGIRPTSEQALEPRGEKRQA